MFESLQRIAAELARWDIPMNLDPVDLRLASYWDVAALEGGK